MLLPDQRHTGTEGRFGPIFQIGPAVIIAQGPQLAGLAVKSHALRFFNAHFRRHDEGQADDVVVSPMNVIMDLTSAKSMLHLQKRPLCSKGPN